MKIFAKIMLFISAYTPLFLIIIMKNYPQLADLYVNWAFLEIIILIVIALIIIISNLFLLFYLFGIVKSRSTRTFEVKSSINKTSDTLNYLLPYIIGLIGFNITLLQDLISLAILLFIVFVVYINSNLILMNPLLNALGFKFYGLELKNGDNIIVITKKDIKNNISINPKRIDKGLYIIRG